MRLSRWLQRICCGCRGCRWKKMARAAGVQCFDTVYTDLDDMEGFRKEVEMNKMMGFDGKSLINPRQISVVHEVYTPGEKEIIFAEKVGVYRGEL